ncbi:MAG: hypothetical protein A3A80_03540 [Candidatus Terrybacteria bacterium RIFCSPLOWO2_01_FULL_44_24]|uniref:Uncharacterized protein n=1 Tax=Candidatus Terrybacteria bacterium RIFCSPHIGHO2_01_FULL_43_35 TaxID=1802361 RepID=A0A1G2PDK3_9BACT|nr:MAG: hypothetical protein A2828_00460 [Candidatus Terrybacteria bacterium RIFCSPHIGHO2_01_FULL_43_35]OHA49756.1 MAG: hypothetical protein A3B75_02035 [Candidatus Terrybacteria bacterium RIFCSPHIGHO2_02_FULL_43_14]OHA51578.1 MAG: hypothetical protein A3A80_03540 [Candidatus Terrybacteria bacterium RIFCSPLOWO2_01_FULL_44_24]
MRTLIFTIFLSFIATFGLAALFSGRTFYMSAYSVADKNVFNRQESFFSAAVGSNLPEIVSSFFGTILIISGGEIAVRLVQRRRRQLTKLNMRKIKRLASVHSIDKIIPSKHLHARLPHKT